MTDSSNFTGTTTSTPWPTGTEYAEAVQQPGKAFSRPDLAAGQLTLTMLGLPAMASGQNAVAFHLETAESPVAVRCLLSANDDGRERYQALARYMETVDIPSMVPASWIDEGVRVNGRWWPVVVMPWVDGAPLHTAIEDRLDDPKRLETISERFLGLVSLMQSNHMAHGDLQHGNVLLNDDDRFQLVDLDGIWVPSMGVGAPDEYGHPNYQHSRRDDAAWGPNVDTFSAMVIITSITALAADPSLKRFMSGENLLFTKDDFSKVGSSEIWRALEASPDPFVVDLVSRLAHIATQPRPPSMTLMELLQDDTLDLTQAIPTAATSDRLPTIDANTASGDWWNGGPAGNNSGTYWGNGQSGPPGAAQPAAAAAAPWGVAPAATPTPPASPAASQPTSTKATGLAAITGKPIATGVVAGAFAGLFGSILAGILQGAIDNPELDAGVFVGMLAAMLGGFVAAWPSLNLKAYSAAGSRFAIGAGMGLLAGIVAVMFADVLIRSTLEVGQTAHAGLVVYVWALAAALIGLAIGALQSVKAAAYAFAGGAVAGALGGVVHGATTAEFEQRRLIIDAADGGMILIATVVAIIIGTLVALSIRTARSGSLVVIEGPGSGTTIDFHKRGVTIGGARSDTLVISGMSLPAKAIQMSINGSVANTTSSIPVMVNGSQATGRFDVHDGQVLAFNGVFVRFELKGEEASS